MPKASSERIGSYSSANVSVTIRSWYLLFSASHNASREVPDGTEAERLVRPKSRRLFFSGTLTPDAVHAQAGRFRARNRKVITRHGVTGIAAATVFTAQDDLDAGGLGPAVDVDKENHADDIIGAGRIELTVIVMVGVSQYGPCDGAAGFRITHTGFGGCLTGFPSPGSGGPTLLRWRVR